MNDEKKNKGDAKLRYAGIGMIIVAIILILAFFMRGETKTSGNWPEPKTTQSTTCTSDNIAYPFFNFDNSNQKSFTINAIFNDESLASISLLYQLYYNDAALISKSSSENHAAMNLRFQAEGLGPDAFNASYAQLSDKMEFSLYTSASNVNTNTDKYFLLEGISPKTYDWKTITKTYEDTGFTCITSKTKEND